MFDIGKSNPLKILINLINKNSFEPPIRTIRRTWSRLVIAPTAITTDIHSSSQVMGTGQNCSDSICQLQYDRIVRRPAYRLGCCWMVQRRVWSEPAVFNGRHVDKIIDRTFANHHRSVGITPIKEIDQSNSYVTHFMKVFSGTKLTVAAEAFRVERGVLLGDRCQFLANSN